MKSRRRDDFSQAVKKLVAERAGYRYAYPSCGAPTTGPGRTADKSMRVGVAAHITAAAPGSKAARYDKSLTPEQRSSASNAIWMCWNHGKAIDDDEDGFPTEYLVTLKAAAEAEAARQLGVPRSGALTFSAIDIREDLCGWHRARRFRSTGTRFGFHIVPRRSWADAGLSLQTHCVDPVLDLTLLNTRDQPVVVTRIGLRVLNTWTSVKGLPEATPIRSSGDYVLKVRRVEPGHVESLRFPAPFHVPMGGPLRVGLQLGAFTKQLGRQGNESEVAFFVHTADAEILSWPVYLGIY